jgi:hypothetical protein
MADNLREVFQKALAKEPAEAFLIAFKAGFRFAEFRNHEHQAMIGKVVPATDKEIARCCEKALRSSPVE